MDKQLAEQSLISNRYQIVRPIGRGGMGAVYEAIDTRLQTTVALKQRTAVVDEIYRRAFEREARILARLRHPGLPVVSDHFFEGEDQYLVMEYVGGPNLQELLSEHKGTLAEPDALRIADQLLEILEYLHTHSPPIIHRDIKPLNIKISSASGRAVLLDFGLAKGSGAAGSSQTLAMASVFGYTPDYSPPEQINDTGTDQRSDLYSLGATLYHLLIGASPPSAQTRLMATAVQKAPDPLPSAHEINPKVSRDVSTLINRAMALAPSSRYPDAKTMRAALRATATGRRIWSDTGPQPAPQPVIQPAPQPAPRPTPPTERLNLPDEPDAPGPQPAAGGGMSRMLIFGGIAVALLLVLIGGGAAFFMGQDPPPAPTPTAVIEASATVALPTRTARPTRTAEPSITPTEIPAPTGTTAPSATVAPTETAAPTSTPRPAQPTPRPVQPTPRPVQPTPRPAPPTQPPVDPGIPTIAPEDPGAIPTIAP